MFRERERGPCSKVDLFLAVVVNLKLCLRSPCVRFLMFSREEERENHEIKQADLSRLVFVNLN